VPATGIEQRPPVGSSSCHLPKVVAEYGTSSVGSISLEPDHSLDDRARGEFVDHAVDAANCQVNGLCSLLRRVAVIPGDSIPKLRDLLYKLKEASGVSGMKQYSRYARSEVGGSRYVLAGRS
jgi:hypothetical protein